LLICLVGAIVVASGCLSPGCGTEGQQVSVVYKDKYPEKCCEGLTQWDSGMDTRISIADKCYETGLVSGNPVGTCIKCGDGICGTAEDACNCPDDCIGKGRSTYNSIEDFCSSEFWVSMKEQCDLGADLPICGLCLLSIQPACEDYTYSNCLEGCLQHCVPSACSEDQPPICTADCDGPGSCLTRE